MAFGKWQTDWKNGELIWQILPQILGKFHWCSLMQNVFCQTLCVSDFLPGKQSLVKSTRGKKQDGIVGKAILWYAKRSHLEKEFISRERERNRKKKFDLSDWLSDRMFVFASDKSRDLNFFRHVSIFQPEWMKKLSSNVISLNSRPLKSIYSVYQWFEQWSNTLCFIDLDKLIKKVMVVCF